MLKRTTSIFNIYIQRLAEYYLHLLWYFYGCLPLSFIRAQINSK